MTKKEQVALAAIAIFVGGMVAGAQALLILAYFTGPLLSPTTFPWLSMISILLMAVAAVKAATHSLA